MSIEYEEFMAHAADSAHLGDASAMRVYAQQIFAERDEMRAEIERLRRGLNEARAEAASWRATAHDKGYAAREVAQERDKARAEADRLRVVGQSLCNESRAWLDGPATTYGDAVLRDAIDLWDRAVKR